MQRIRATLIAFIVLGLIAGIAGGLRWQGAQAATAVSPTRSFPAPDANVQGLAYGGGSLWAATPSAYDPTTGGYSGVISELDPATGEVRQQFALPNIATGLTHDGAYLYATQAEARASCDDGVSHTTPGAIAV